MSVAEWADLLRADLGTPHEGAEAAVAARTGLQVLDPQSDQLTRQIWPAVDRHLPELTGTLLDVGCYGGWLYPLVREQADYHGIDIWPSAVNAATRMFGPHFELRNVMDVEGEWDVVWCTQIVNVDHNAMWQKLRSLGKRLVIYASPELMCLTGAEMYQANVNRVAVWRAPGA